MTSKKGYFLLPNTDVLPDTLVRLGQVVLSLKEPHRAISSVLAVPKSTYSSTKTMYELSLSSAKSFSAGLMARFLAQLGSPLSGSVSLAREKKNATHWKFDLLETIYFEPDGTYLNQLIQKPDVKQALSKNKLAAVFLITGLKIARGASYTRSARRNQEASTEVLIDATALAGVPVSSGPKLSIGTSKDEKESCTSCSDFVWAVRFRKISLSFFSRRLVEKDVYGGEMVSYDGHMSDGSDSDEESEDDVERELEDVDMEQVDVGTEFTPRGFTRDVVSDENGEECVVFW